MTADLNLLVPELRDKSRRLIANCLAKGCEMRPNYGVRDPWDQARLWRQSRTIQEIQQLIDGFKAGGADFLASCVESVGARQGDHATDTPPGYSWHQWGEAVDCFWVVNGRAEWSTTKKIHGVNGYQLYADEAEALGLTAGGHWARFKDWGHVQLRATLNAGNVFSMTEIDAAMRARFQNPS